MTLQSGPPANVHCDLQWSHVCTCIALKQSTTAMSVPALSGMHEERVGGLPPLCQQCWAAPSAHAQLWRAGSSWPQQAHPAPQTGLHTGYDISMTALATHQTHLLQGSLLPAARGQLMSGRRTLTGLAVCKCTSRRDLWAFTVCAGSLISTRLTHKDVYSSCRFWSTKPTADGSRQR